ncbi:hypothetical protein I6F40_19465 [Pseudoalteromonas sp. SWXJ133]|jgi:hypothetical protein|uniref:hypothetical protein n=1 Tax=Pseudoalteromonas sp. SWXJ133 TaxID=2792069 RepID=UPI0018CF6C97|nr:hypothetical protein [Pseudoalteromonas sp. SWXJ133]MBH0022496.1 hypothetical protein [Pseudoalteromonas sp. SWXJ133]MBH0022497.1 hypothetical protein [Pseudoalteromonas sp. SWXJ133]
MHPFSLEKSQEEQVVGGKGDINFTLSLKEDGGPGDVVTMAIPEDGNDPRPFPPEEWM